MDHNLWLGQKVHLRAVEPDDWGYFFHQNEDTDIARDAYWIPFPRSQAGQQKWAVDQALAGPDNDTFRWVIETLQGEPVGTINTHGCNRQSGTFSYGLAIHRDHWRKGYGSEAIQIVLRYFFEELRYQKVTVTVFEFNQASIELHEKLGFQHEGRMRRTVFTGGKHYDEIIMGLTVEEFAAQNAEK